MSTLANLGNASNEKREQRIIKLRQAFLHKQVITVGSATKFLMLSSKTIIKYCVDGNIPLINGDTGVPVVPLTDANRPQWLQH